MLYYYEPYVTIDKIQKITFGWPNDIRSSLGAVSDQINGSRSVSVVTDYPQVTMFLTVSMGIFETTGFSLVDSSHHEAVYKMLGSSSGFEAMAPFYILGQKIF